MNNQRRHLGNITKWNREKQFGFVSSINDGKAYFIHRSQLGQDVCEGAVVEFEVWHDKIEPDRVFAAKAIVVELPEETTNR